MSTFFCCWSFRKTNLWHAEENLERLKQETIHLCSKRFDISLKDWEALESAKTYLQAELEQLVATMQQKEKVMWSLASVSSTHTIFVWRRSKKQGSQNIALHAAPADRTSTYEWVKDLNRRSSHDHHGSKRCELAQHTHSHGLHAFTHILTSTQLQPCAKLQRNYYFSVHAGSFVFP